MQLRKALRYLMKVKFLLAQWAAVLVIGNGAEEQPFASKPNLNSVGLPVHLGSSLQHEHQTSFPARDFGMRTPKSLWLPQSQRHGSSLLLLGIVAAALVTVYLVVACFRMIQNSSTSEMMARRLQGGPMRVPPSCAVSYP